MVSFGGWRGLLRSAAVPAAPFRWREVGWAYLVLTPSLGLLAIFCLVPFVWAFTKSFYNFEVGGDQTFVGFGNYIEYLTNDPTLLPSLGHMLVLTLVMLTVSLTVPLLVAKLIFELTRFGGDGTGERAAHFYRVLFIAPIVVPGVAIQTIWATGIYGQDGLLPQLLAPLGIDAGGLLTSPATALFAIAMVGFPFAQGINVLIFYAGLADIPESVHEAALLDGDRGVGKFLRIDVPMVLSQVKLLAILATITGIQGFEAIFIMTRGGPGFSTMVPGLWMYYNAFSFQRMGYACAIGVLLFLLVLGLTALNARFLRTTQDLQR